METNYQLIGGLDSAYGRGIRQAMLDAGLDGKDVMLVGHSQGGMVSTALAADPDFTRHFTVQHVVTAGAPTAQVPDLPAGTQGLHLENRGDAVPLLDGEDNPDQPHRTTVLFDDGSHDIVDNHDLRHYTDGAAAADASTNGSIRSHLDRMRDDGYLGDGPSGSVRTYVITR
jgi:pimeloyl-ACP methyl ester carboxylesterase